jgi:hypothetical protein
VNSLNFGFQPVGSVSGTVYQDVNGPKGVGADGAFESGTDTPLQSWTVTLYDGSRSRVGSPVTTDASGNYSIAAAFDPTQTYQLCVTSPIATGPWAQSEPLPTSADNCSLAKFQPALQKGQTFTPSSSGDNVTENFGVVEPVTDGGTCPPPSPFGIDNTGTGGSALHIQLATCKPGQTYVFNSGVLLDGETPFVSVWANDQTLGKVPLIEHIVFPDPIVPSKDGGGAPKYTGLAYTDVFPYNPDAAEPMAVCKKDPRVPGLNDPNGLMTLPQTFTDTNFHNDVLPATNAGTATPATSCVLSVMTFVDASGNTWLDAYAASDIDGFTKPIG